MDQVPCLCQADDKPFFLLLFKKLIIKLAPVSSPINSIDTLFADVIVHGIDYFEYLVILAFEVVGFLRISFQIEGNDHFMLYICATALQSQ